MTHFTGRLKLGMVVNSFENGFGFIKDLDTGFEFYLHARHHGAVESAGERSEWPIVLKDEYGYQPYVPMPSVGTILRYMEDTDNDPRGSQVLVWVLNDEYLKVKHEMERHSALLRRCFPDTQPPRQVTATPTPSLVGIPHPSEESSAALRQFGGQ